MRTTHPSSLTALVVVIIILSSLHLPVAGSTAFAYWQQRRQSSSVPPSSGSTSSIATPAAPSSHSASVPTLHLTAGRTTSTCLHSSSTTVMRSDSTPSRDDPTEADPGTGLISSLRYRPPTQDDIARCYEIESSSYPPDEAATIQSLLYRQEHALEYFQLCTLATTGTNQTDDDDKDGGNDSLSSSSSSSTSVIVGFVCGTRCEEFTEESMSTRHDPDGRLLAVHSVVVDGPYRRRGVATAMLRQYVKTIVEKQQQKQQQQQQKQQEQLGYEQQQTLGRTPPPIQSMVLLSKKHLLSFYVDCGFQVNRPSPIVHGKELWYELERRITPAAAGVAASAATTTLTTSDIPRTLPHEDESWFCKTERFKRPYPDVKPYLVEHKQWVNVLRQQGYCITSGYRVDADGRPGGGGLMFVAARSYRDAWDLVLQDPLVANDCVEWELNGWIGQVGDLQMR